jgi:hypothetical protein
MVVIVWLLDLQLPVQIATKVVRSNPVHGEVYAMQHYVIKLVSDLRQGEWFSLGTLISSTNKTDRHDIAECLIDDVFRLCLKQVHRYSLNQI